MTFQAMPSFVWVAPDGTSVPLDWTAGVGWHLLPGLKGLGAAPRTITTDPLYRGGVAVRNTAKTARRLTVPLFIGGADHGGFLGNYRFLADKFTQTDEFGPGLFRIARPDGTTRVIDAVYEDGFTSGDADLDVTAEMVALTLLCPSPWWRDLSPTQITRSFDPNARSYLSPYPAVSSTLALGTTLVTNPGSTQVWPNWTVTGPATLITALNNTTGESWSMDPNLVKGAPLSAGEQVTITTDPPTVRGPVVSGSANWIKSITWPGAVLWALRRGDNQITYTVTGGGPGTSIAMEFYARYETA